jgi:hypothetical protein
MERDNLFERQHIHITCLSFNLLYILLNKIETVWLTWRQLQPKQLKMTSLPKPKLIRMQTNCPGYSRAEEERMEKENQEYWTRVRVLRAIPPPPELVRSTNKPPEYTLFDEPASNAEEPEPLDDATLEEVPVWTPLTRHDTSIGGWVAERAV